MNPIDALKEVGRGRNSARPLSREQAASVFGQMLAGTIDPLPLGALLMAWRIKGESIEELAGFLDAAHAAMVRLPADAPGPARPLVVIPSYNGARSRPNLVPLLARALRAAGLQVLVHGVIDDPRRVTTAQVFGALGEPACGSMHEAGRRLRGNALAFIGIDAMAPGLARLLGLRWQIGVRSSAHTVVKMLDPAPSAALRLLSVTHPDYLAAMHAYYTAHPASVLLMRGTEGEAVVRTARPQAMEWLHDGRAETVLAADDRENDERALGLPDPFDIVGTARWIEDAASGARPLPAPMAAQVAAIVRIANARGRHA